MVLKHEGKVIDREVQNWTKEKVDAALARVKAAAESRRIVVKVGTVAKPLDQFPPGHSFGENVESDVPPAI
jgi:hypothetical protein